MAVYSIDIVFLKPLYQPGSLFWIVYPVSAVDILQDQR